MVEEFAVQAVERWVSTYAWDAARKQKDETSEGERKRLIRYCDNGFGRVGPKEIL